MVFESCFSLLHGHTTDICLSINVKGFGKLRSTLREEENEKPRIINMEFHLDFHSACKSLKVLRFSDTVLKFSQYKPAEKNLFHILNLQQNKILNKNWNEIMTLETLQQRIEYIYIILCIAASIANPTKAEQKRVTSYFDPDSSKFSAWDNYDVHPSPFSTTNCIQDSSYHKYHNAPGGPRPHVCSRTEGWPGHWPFAGRAASGGTGISQGAQAGQGGRGDQERQGLGEGQCRSDT